MRAEPRRSRFAISAVLIGAVLALALVTHHVAGHAAAVGATPDTAHPGVADLIGLTLLERELGPSTPTGRGVILGHVEGQPGDYLPDTTAPAFRDLSFVLHSGPGGRSDHSDATTRMIVGRTGLAPGITRVDCFAAGSWMERGFLHRRSVLAPGQVEPSALEPQPATGHDAMLCPAQLYTHSWIAPTFQGYEDILRRIDCLADTRGIVMVVGVNNGAEKPVPPLLASGYNTIAVGQWDGQSSGGYTTVEGAGRCKPDIVAPGGLTSFATPVVGAVVARLMDAARQSGDADALRPQVLKAVLLAGADKPPGWHRAPGHSGGPLDEHLGAGRVRLDRSYFILEGGLHMRLARGLGSSATTQAARASAPKLAAQTQPAELTERYGWVYADLAPHATQDFSFAMPRGQGELSLMLVWHRRISGRIYREIFTDKPYWNDTPRLAHLGLSLFVGGDGPGETMVSQSESAVDNLQHIYLPALAAGHYRIHVDRRDTLDEAWDYALAWRIEPRGGE